MFFKIVAIFMYFGQINAAFSGLISPKTLQNLNYSKLLTYF